MLALVESPVVGVGRDQGEVRRMGNRIENRDAIGPNYLLSRRMLMVMASLMRSPRPRTHEAYCMVAPALGVCGIRMTMMCDLSSDFRMKIFWIEEYTYRDCGHRTIPT
jgi:hypothetical protein